MKITAGLSALAAGVVALACVGLISCQSPQARAIDQADGQAAAAKHRIDPRNNAAIPAESMGRRAIDLGYRVSKVEGRDTRSPQGVTLTIVVVSTINHGMWYSDPEEFTFCYELWYGSSEERSPKRVPCPDTAPVSYPPLPPDPRLPTPDELAALLRNGTGDEAAVRERLTGLGLDPSIKVRVGTVGGRVGVALRWDSPHGGGYDCVLGSVGASGAQAWVPARVYLQPGEMSCTAGEAAAGAGQRPPH